MKLNANFTQSVFVHNADQHWVPSPMPGVERKPLDRVGEEVARATSIVRYAPKSHFSAHVHSGGEEFVVLEGVFQDEHGDYPAGSYVRNPPQSKHVPGSETGCVIFVKLWQFQAEDRQHVNVMMENVEATNARSVDGEKSARTVIAQRVLFSDQLEEVKHITLPADSDWDCDANNGIEVLVLEGSIKHHETTLMRHDWLRLPISQTLSVRAGSEGAKLWLKSGNLPDIENQIKRVLIKQPKHAN